MTLAEREQQIWRVKQASFQSELDEQLEKQLRQQVVMTVQTMLEAALVEEVKVDQATLRPKPRRCGYFQRTLDTQYGRIDQLAVPKLRHCNKERSWRILTGYQRSLGGLLDFAGYLLDFIHFKWHSRWFRQDQAKWRQELDELCFGQVSSRI